LSQHIERQRCEHHRSRRAAESVGEARTRAGVRLLRFEPILVLQRGERLFERLLLCRSACLTESDEKELLRRTDPWGSALHSRRPVDAYPDSGTGLDADVRRFARADRSMHVSDVEIRFRTLDR
jgi:hypothetical protein